jgi:hypothetical protein
VNNREPYTVAQVLANLRIVEQMGSGTCPLDRDWLQWMAENIQERGIVSGEGVERRLKPEPLPIYCAKCAQETGVPIPAQPCPMRRINRAKNPAKQG